MKALCADMGSEVGIRLELDAAAADGILDRQGLAKVRHIDINRVWLQEQCAKKIVPLTKIPECAKSADLMTKHLCSPTNLGHAARLSLDLREGRSDKAAELRSVDKPAGKGKPRGRRTRPPSASRASQR